MTNDELLAKLDETYTLAKAAGNYDAMANIVRTMHDIRTYSPFNSSTSSVSWNGNEPQAGATGGKIDPRLG